VCEYTCEYTYSFWKCVECVNMHIFVLHGEVFRVCEYTYVYWGCVGCVNIHMRHRETLRHRHLLRHKHVDIHMCIGGVYGV